MSDFPSAGVIPDTTRRWLDELDARHDKILLRRAYLDLCEGDHEAAVILAQLIHYHLPDRSGHPTKLRVKKEGHLWVAKRQEDWWAECRVNVHAAKKKITKLKRWGLVRTRNFRFNGLKTQHLRLDFAGLEARVKLIGETGQTPPVGAGRSDRNGSNRSGPPAPTGQAGRLQPLTETTGKVDEQRSEPPKSSAAAEDFSQSLSFSSGPGEAVDAPGTSDAPVKRLPNPAYVLDTPAKGLANLLPALPCSRGPKVTTVQRTISTPASRGTNP